MERAAERERIAQEKYDRQNDENKGFRKKALERAEEREQEARERYEEQQNKESRFSALAKNAPLCGRPKGKSVWLEETGNEIEFSGKKKIGCFSNLFYVGEEKLTNLW